MTTRSAHGLVSAVLVSVLMACEGTDGVPDLPSGVDPTAQPPAATAAESLLPACPELPSPAAQRVPGLVLPDGSVITEVSSEGPITTVRGFIPLTPVEVREFYEGRDDLQVLVLEDEGFEAEALFGDSDQRTYVKAKVFCRDGSSLLAVIGTAEGAEAVPEPSGRPSPS